MADSFTLPRASASRWAPAPWERQPRWLVKGLIFSAVYALAARIGFSYSSIAHNVTLIWAPTGLSLFVLLRWGPGLWPGIVLGDLLANAGSGTPWLGILALPLETSPKACSVDTCWAVSVFGRLWKGFRTPSRCCWLAPVPMRSTPSMAWRAPSQQSAGPRKQLSRALE